jgi:glycerol kinase
MPVLAIDQSTTSTRALVCDTSGKAEIICAFEHQQHYPRAGWMEHDPEELLRNIQQYIALAITMSSSTWNASHILIFTDAVRFAHHILRTGITAFCSTYP